MGELFAKIWYMIAMLPFFIFQEGSAKWAAFLKKRGLYEHWDNLHSLLVVLIILAIVLWRAGFR